ncbi:S41 family peptidase [Pedobacter sp. AW31-3R]|uniref:S41 family peptidase n=1 Tax=Pedobacter sp. AW31-3R TaxID=3445781 RepID=UPI003F9ECEB7
MKKTKIQPDTFFLPGYCRNILIILVSILALSCKKQAPVNLDENPDNFSKIFVQFWDKMNNQYVYWDKDNTDWDAIYKQYKPLFDNLSNSNSDKLKAVTYFREITSNLIDNHFRIRFNEPVIASFTINPATDRKSKTSNFHSRFNYDDVVKTYLDNGYLSGDGTAVIENTVIKATSGTINNNLLYFHCNLFALKQSYESNDGNKVKQILDYFFAQLKRTSNPIKGIILDLRNNTGGNIIDLNFFAGKLAPKDITFGYTRSKSGLGKLDYLPWLEARLKHDTDYSVNVPIILLGDNFSASLSEITIIALRNNKNILIGEQTYGATGPLSDTEIFNSGSFSIGNFMEVTTSTTEFKGLNDTFYENVGIKPDIVSPFNLRELLIGKDPQLELAISQIK